MSTLRYIYLVRCLHKSPNHRLRGEFRNVAFDSESEAKAYCQYHSDGMWLWSWEPIQIGTFPVEKTKTRKRSKP